MHAPPPVTDPPPPFFGPDRGWWFWLRQLVPPLALLWPASTTHGPSMYLVHGLLVLVMLVCLLRLIWLAGHWRTTRSRVFRPLLALCVGVSILNRPEDSARPAMTFACETAWRVQAACDAHRACPDLPPGWPVTKATSGSRARADVGRRVKWPVVYDTDARTFSVRARESLDSDLAYWSGGVGLTPVRHAPGDSVGPLCAADR